MAQDNPYEDVTFTSAKDEATHSEEIRRCKCRILATSCRFDETVGHAAPLSGLRWQGLAVSQVSVEERSQRVRDGALRIHPFSLF